MEFTLYTDGACRGNPGVGGWGAVFVFGSENRLFLKGAAAHTTNNRMELLGPIRALSALEHRAKVRLFTDSTYVQKGIEEWLPKWIQNGWKNSQKESVKNQDLWELLLIQKNRHDVSFHWVKGHASDVHNQKADALANQAVDEFLAAKAKA